MINMSMANQGERRKKQHQFDSIKQSIRTIESIVEVCLLVLAYYFILAKMNTVTPSICFYDVGYVMLLGIYTVILVLFFVNCESFKFGYLKLTDVLLSQWIATACVNIITMIQYSFIVENSIAIKYFMGLTIIQWGIEFILCYGYTRLYHKLYVAKKILMVCGYQDQSDLMTKMNRRDDRYHITKTVDAAEGYEKITNMLADYDAVVINDVKANLRNDLLKYCYTHDIRTYLTPKLSDIIISGGDSITLFDTPLTMITGGGLTVAQKFYKRFFDIVLSLLAMLVAGPIMLIVAICIKLEDGGPVFYCQDRITRDNKVFSIIKLRSMIVDAEKDGEAAPAVDGDSRITKVGKFTRATRIDELPQLFNILKGEMSIVGPRPERIEHVDKYNEEIEEFDYRHKVKAGLTGPAQIFGKYNTNPYDKLRLDLMYIEKYSLMYDFKMILMTLRILLKKESTEGFEESK